MSVGQREEAWGGGPAKPSQIAAVADWLCGRRVGSHPLSPAMPPSMPRFHTARAPRYITGSSPSVLLEGLQLAGRVAICQSAGSHAGTQDLCVKIVLL